LHLFFLFRGRRKTSFAQQAVDFFSGPDSVYGSLIIFVSYSVEYQRSKWIRGGFHNNTAIAQVGINFFNFWKSSGKVTNSLARGLFTLADNIAPLGLGLFHIAEGGSGELANPRITADDICALQ